MDLEHRKAYKKHWQNKWNRENPDKVKLQAHKRYLTHREKILENNRKWKLANPEKVREMNRRRYHRDPIYAGMKRTARRYKCLPDLLKQILERDRCCQNCWIHENLSFDHIVPMSKNGKTEYDNLQVLCRSCNSAKGNS